MSDSGRQKQGSAEVRPRTATETWERRVALDLRSRFAPDHVVRPGQNIGKYVLGEPIARGGMAEVWGARVEGPQGFVKSLALKFILESFSGDSDLERLFVNEARLAAQLQHANLVTVFDFDKIADPDGSPVGRYYIAMERVDGHDLRRVLQAAQHRGRRLTPAIALHVAGEVLKGLRYVHEKRDPETYRPMGLIHRDVSPHNILVGFAGEVKVSDFGIAKAMTQNLGTQSGTIRGKLAYASPEQLRAEPIDHRTDQFALGVTLWEALAGQRLFDGADEMAVMSKVMNGVIPSLPATAGVPRATEAIVRRMLASAAKDRYPATAEALSAILAAPGYTADAAPLSTLMRELYPPPEGAPGGLPRTAPVDTAALVAPPLMEAGSPPPSARGGHTLRHDAFGETRPLERDVPEDDGAGGHHAGRMPSASRRTPAPEPARERTRSVTGSAYVSGAVPNEELRAVRGRPTTWIALGVLGAGILTGALVMVGRRDPHAADPPPIDPPGQGATQHDETSRSRRRSEGDAPRVAGVGRAPPDSPLVRDSPSPPPSDQPGEGSPPEESTPHVGSPGAASSRRLDVEARANGSSDRRANRDNGGASNGPRDGAGPRSSSNPGRGDKAARTHKAADHLARTGDDSRSDGPAPGRADPETRPLVGPGQAGTPGSPKISATDARARTGADVTTPGAGPAINPPGLERPSSPSSSTHTTGVTPNDAPVLR